jgi:hypothetical protein
MKVIHLNAAYIHQHWDGIAEYLQPALDLSGVEEFNLDQLKVFITNKQWILFVAENEGKIFGAAVVSLSPYPNDLIAFVTAIGGKFVSDRQVSDQFKSLLKSMGATKIQGYARESVARLWKRIGFENKQILVEYRL